MTWDELAKAILEMPDGEREKTVFYREPYDKQSEMFPVDLIEADEDLENPEGEVKVRKGESFLQ